MRQRLPLVYLCLMGAVRADCIDDAARHHRVNPYVLRAIGWQESRLNPDALHRNDNGTTDFGAFQINSIHLRALGDAGITSRTLRDGCVSAYVAAWHYRHQVDRYGNTWTAVGAYHSASPPLNHAYANAVVAILASWGVVSSGPLPFPVSAGSPASRRRPRAGVAADVAPVASTGLRSADTSIVFDAGTSPADSAVSRH